MDEYTILYPPIPTAGVYLFTTDKGIEYEVRFGRKKDAIFHATVVFGVINEIFDGNEYQSTNKGEIYKVMATIVKIVKNYMKEHPKVNKYEFVALTNESEENKNSRLKLYERYIKKELPRDWMYEISGNRVVIYKKTAN